MTPATIAGMCKLSGLDAAALTDHNTCGNCAAFCQAAEAYGLLALPGMELCTREEVHIVCVFPDLERAGAFQEEVYRSLGRPATTRLFSAVSSIWTPTTVCWRGAPAAGGGDRHRRLRGARPGGAVRRGGLARPYRRSSFSLLSNLGLWDPGLGFSLAEVSRNCPPDFVSGRRDLRGVPTITAVTPTIWSRSQMPGRLWRSPPGPGRRCWPGCAGAARERTGSAARKARPRLAVPVRNRGS